MHLARLQSRRRLLHMATHVWVIAISGQLPKVLPAGTPSQPCPRRCAWHLQLRQRASAPASPHGRSAWRICGLLGLHYAITLPHRARGQNVLTSLAPRGRHLRYRGAAAAAPAGNLYRFACWHE